MPKEELSLFYIILLSIVSMFSWIFLSFLKTANKTSRHTYYCILHCFILNIFHLVFSQWYDFINYTEIKNKREAKYIWLMMLQIFYNLWLEKFGWFKLIELIKSGTLIQSSIPKKNICQAYTNIYLQCCGFHSLRAYILLNAAHE